MITYFKFKDLSSVRHKMATQNIRERVSISSKLSNAISKLK